jgi:hypothetical protein
MYNLFSRTTGAGIFQNQAQKILLYEQNLMLSTVQDITENKTRQSQLRHARKIKTLDRLAGKVAHAFKNVL